MQVAWWSRKVMFQTMFYGFFCRVTREGSPSNYSCNFLTAMNNGLGKQVLDLVENEAISLDNSIKEKNRTASSELAEAFKQRETFNQERVFKTAATVRWSKRGFKFCWGHTSNLLMKQHLFMKSKEKGKGLYQLKYLKNITKKKTMYDNAMMSKVHCCSMAFLECKPVA